ncbi:hypothetical protein LOD99_16287 [Oopsacas minuta]|uniref:von Willebrand factor A domain-containing protein 5A n=1 Tax=Oopsacas minuta TaxID=111878 RepID=A0AAV7K7H8_9METZ|nr:hypothetical protein LOD99_16287 [Oopsacas minuta]
MSLCMRRCKRAIAQKFPIDSLFISGRIEGLALFLNCEYSYTNTLSAEGVEVEFVFPTPDGATVCSLNGEIDGREVKGVIREKREAKDSYDDAISSGYSAGIIEKVRKNEFRMLLGNLSPNGRAVLRISLLSELELNSEGIAHLCIPAAMLPYADSFQNPCKFSLELYIEKRVGEFSQIESTSHKISYSKEGNGEMVRIKDELPTEHKDIEILMKPSFIDLPLVSTHPPTAKPLDNTHRYLSSHAYMLTFIPKLDSDSTQCPAEFIFIIDRSGSMSGPRIRHAKSTLELLLQSLSIGCYFNIIGFGSDFELLSSEKSLEYTQETLDSSLKVVRSLKADLGGTCLLPPLITALELPTTENNLSRQIMILTDGDTERVSEIIRMVESSPQTFRVFSFGIGTGASKSLVTGVATAGRGKAVYIQNASEMEEKVLEIMNLAFNPDLRDVEVEISHPTEYYPSKLPNLFLNERLILYGFIKDIPEPVDTQIQAKLSFTLEGNRRSIVSEFNLAPDSLTPQADISMVHLLGSSLALKHWEKQKDRKEECVLLSCATGIMCEHTAYLLTDSTQSVPVDAPISKLTARLRRRWNSSPICGSAPTCGSSESESDDEASPRLRNRVYSSQIQKRKKRKMEKNQVNCLYKHTMSIPRSRPRSRSRSRSPNRDRCKRYRAGRGRGAVGFVERSDAPPPIAMASTSYQSITCLQRAEGSWEYSKELEKELLVDLKATCPDGISLPLWVTLVCISCLRANFSTFQTQWLLVVKKGESWAKRELSSLAHKFSYQELSGLARQIVSQH